MKELLLLKSGPEWTHELLLIRGLLVHELRVLELCLGHRDLVLRMDEVRAFLIVYEEQDLFLEKDVLLLIIILELLLGDFYLVLRGACLLVFLLVNAVFQLLFLLDLVEEGLLKVVQLLLRHVVLARVRL